MHTNNRAARPGALPALSRQQKIEALKALAAGEATLVDLLLPADFSMIIKYGNNGSPLYIAGEFVYTETEFTQLLARHNKTFEGLQCVITIDSVFPETWVRLPRYADRFKKDNQKP